MISRVRCLVYGHEFPVEWSCVGKFELISVRGVAMSVYQRACSRCGHLERRDGSLSLVSEGGCCRPRGSCVEDEPSTLELLTSLILRGVPERQSGSSEERE